MEPELRNRLLESIEAGRLVVFCGAGLSMAEPSNLPSARQLANLCYDEYVQAVDPDCNPSLRDNLEAFAEYFAARNLLEQVFITRFVPWDSFMRPSNPGHAALADFLLCHVIAAVLSTNYDLLIEHQAHMYGADIDPSLDGDEANIYSNRHSPFLKFHGCSRRDKRKTIWTRSQLTDQTIRDRIQKTRVWMAANLREKDLLIIGFWSDWSYLNEILDNALQGVSPSSITVIDLGPTNSLEEKAPQLWAIAHRAGVVFRHVRMSGAEFLNELRREFSKRYLAKVLAAGRVVLEEQTGAACNVEWLAPPDLSVDELYALRRDAEGVPPDKPARKRAPENVSQLGFFHLLLKRAGAAEAAFGYILNDLRIRVINGAGDLIAKKKKQFLLPPAIGSDVNIIACIGAHDFRGLPDQIVEQGREKDFIRPVADARWLDLSGAIDALRLG